MLEVRMKEEGEITDDDDDTQVAGIIPEIAVTEKEPHLHVSAILRSRRQVLNRRRNRAAGRSTYPVSVRNDRQRSYGSQKFFDSARQTAVPSLMELPVSAVTKTKSDHKAYPASHTAITSSFTHPRPPLLPLPLLHLGQQYPSHPHVVRNISSDSDFQQRSWPGIDSQNSQTSDCYEVTGNNDTTIVISDSDASNDEVLDSEVTPEDDLDELQLRREALDSAVRSNRLQVRLSMLHESDSTGLLNSEVLHSHHIPLDSTSVPNLPDLHVDNNYVQCGVTENLQASAVSGVVVPVTTGSETYMALGQQNSAMSSSSSLNAEIPALQLANSSHINSLAMTNQGLVVSQDEKQPLVDNYDEVEMDLDSGSESDSQVPVVKSMVQPSEFTSNIPDQNFPQNQFASTSVDRLELSADSEPLLKTLCTSSDNAITQFSVSQLAAGGSTNVAVNCISEDTVVSSIHEDKVEVPLHAATETMDSCNSDNLQQQRKAEDADTKSELLLRAAVLQSLSSKRQQQQLQVDAVPCIPMPRDRLNTAKLQVTVHPAKRTVTPASSSHLPVHQPVVISLTGESSDSDDAEQREIASASDRSKTSESLVGMINNLDKVLGEIRRTTEVQTSQDCDIAVAPSRQVENATAVMRSTSESALGKQHILSNSVDSLMSFSTYSKTLSTKGPVKSTGDSTQIDIDDSSLQTIALVNLRREISLEKRKLQQQKIAFAKTKLKMARKKEQIDAADKRIMKVREQLIAAKKIAASSKKQLQTLCEETLTISHGIEEHQKSIRRLEVELSIAENNFESSAKENGCDSQNLQSLQVKVSNPLSSDIKVSCKWSDGTVEGTSSSRVSSVAVKHQDSVRRVTVLDTPRASLSTSQTSLNNSDTDSHSVKRTKVHDSASTLEAPVSPKVKRLKHLNATGALKSQSDMALVKDKFVTTTEVKSEAKGNEITPSETAEQHIASHSVNSAFPDVSEQQSDSQASQLGECTVIKPRISVIKSEILTVQKATGASNDDLAVVSGTTGSDHFSSTSLDEFAMPSDKKIKQIFLHYNSSLEKNSSLCSFVPSCQLFISDPVFSFQFPGNATLSVTGSFLEASHKSDTLEIGDSYKPYHSSLMFFKSYRFSDFCHQTGLSVLSETFSHKLDCNVPLCQFDLMGRCLDESCSWQHRSDYSLSKREHLVDIVSYCPSLVGIDNSTPVSKYEQLLNQYVEKYLKVRPMNTQLSHSEQCLCLIDLTKSAAGLAHPHAVCTSARHWKLHRSKQRFSADDKNDLLFSLDGTSELCIPEAAAESLATDDIRYWMVAEFDHIKNLEEAVQVTPSDGSLWIKLAYAKMMEMKLCASHDEYISYGLNVLTRALEANPSNSNLWTHYLDLYMMRSRAQKDISSLFEQAIQYAPSYEFFWKYLQLPISYSEKMDICKRLRQYLCSPMCHDAADTRSHHLLETVLYQAALCTMSGRFKIGLQVIQAIVQSKASVIWLTLSSCDRIVMWLSFIHLYECRELPKTLFNPANSNPGPIVRKDAFVIPFRVGTVTRISYETLLQLFQSAFSACEKEIEPGSDSCNEYLQWLAALHRSRILLELSCHGWLAARQLCEQFLQQRPYLVDVWLCLVQLIVAGGDNTTDDQTVSSSVSSTIEKAVTNNPHSVPLFLAGVCALIECSDTDGALSFAERCPISLFEVDQLDATSIDPNILYCCLLGQPVPLNYKAPALRSSLPRHYVANEQANLWLCYCLLLDLQGAHDQATETYHLALSCLTRTKDVQRMWLAFLRRSSAIICRHLPWLTLADGAEQKRKLWQQFSSDIDQALVSLPVRRSVPHSSQMWEDYSSHNDIVQLCVSCMSDVEVIQEAYEKYMRQMPGNVELALASLDYLLNRDLVQMTHGLCLVALHTSPKAALLWNVCLRLSQRVASPGIMRSLYAKATKTFPFSASLWKTYIMFELINKSREHVQEALATCRHLQVNVASFLDSLLK